MTNVSITQPDIEAAISTMEREHRRVETICERCKTIRDATECDIFTDALRDCISNCLTGIASGKYNTIEALVYIHTHGLVLGVTATQAALDRLKEISELEKMAGDNHKR
jgi:recombinational DNA repair protein RecR